MRSASSDSSRSNSSFGFFCLAELSADESFNEGSFSVGDVNFSTMDLTDSMSFLACRGSGLGTGRSTGVRPGGNGSFLGPGEDTIILDIISNIDISIKIPG